MKNFWLLYIGYAIVIFLTVYFFSEGQWITFKLVLVSIIYGITFAVPHIILHVKYLQYEKGRSSIFQKTGFSEKEFLRSVTYEKSILRAVNVKHGANWIKYGLYFSWLDYELIKIYYSFDEVENYEIVFTSLNPKILESLKKSLPLDTEMKWLPLA